MSAKINFNQKQEQCLVDLFNHTNAAVLGFQLKETEVSFEHPSVNTEGGERDTRVVMHTNGSTRVRGQTTLQYNRLDMANLPVPAKSLLITLDTQTKSIQDLVPRLNTILGIQLKTTDVVDEAIVVKTMPYGVTKRRITMDESCLMYKGSFEVSLIREEPLSLTRPRVILNPFRVVAEEADKYLTGPEWWRKWATAKTARKESELLSQTKALMTDDYLIDKNAQDEDASTLQFWQRFYPNDNQG